MRIRSFLVVFFVGSTACNSADDTSPRRGNASNDAPVAVFNVTPTSGQAPLTIAVDASESFDYDGPTSSLMYRWDWQNDGTWDTAYSRSHRAEHTYTEAGNFLPVLQVRDSGDKTATVEGEPISVWGEGTPFADLLVDANRDGIIGEDDNVDEDVWSPARGAVFLANSDDDDLNGQRDSNDNTVNGEADALDLTAIKVKGSGGLSNGNTVRISVNPPEARPRVRIFQRKSDSNEPVFSPGAASFTLSASDLVGSDVDLAIEATSSRTSTWNGVVQLQLDILQGTTVVSSDTVALRVAPVIFPDNLGEPVRVFVMRIASAANGSNLPFYNSLQENLPSGVALYTVSDDTYWSDRWVQDNMQIGYQDAPILSAPMRFFLQLERATGEYGLEYLVPQELLDANTGFAYPSGNETSHNYGGNLEVAPAHDNYPLGRIVVGGGDGGTLTGVPNSDTMAAAQRSWLDAQEAQGPSIELSTEWLAVGHVDEYFQFVPNPSGVGKPWKLLMASPQLATQALLTLSDAGNGNAIVFAGRGSQTTVAQILGDEDLMAFNDAAQARIDTARLKLLATIGGSEEDVIDLPVLYEVVPFGAADFAAAYNPGVQNLVTVGDTLFIPDPEGPNDARGDVWQNVIRDRLEPLGITVHFVDVYESYHELMGEAHCGTNVETQPVDIASWEVAP